MDPPFPSAGRDRLRTGPPVSKSPVKTSWPVPTDAAPGELRPEPPAAIANATPPSVRRKTAATATRPHRCRLALRLSRRCRVSRASKRRCFLEVDSAPSETLDLSLLGFPTSASDA